MNINLEHKTPEELRRMLTREWDDGAFLKRSCLEKNICPYSKTGKTGRRKTSIPPLKTANLGRFITAIPRAVASGELTAQQGNHLLYAAQVLISFIRATKPPTPTAARRVGFADSKGESK